MAFIQFKSDNPDFSYVLMKNPSTGMIIKSYRQGLMFGYYSKDDKQTYNIYFKDGDDEISFKKYQDQAYEHNDYKRYNAPVFVQGAINEFLRQLLSENVIEKDIIGYNNEIIINQMYITNPKYIDLLTRYFTDIDFVYEKKNEFNYKVILKSNKKTFRDLVNLSYLISVFYHCVNNDGWIDEGEIEKYVKILNILDAPYFIRYVIKSRIIMSPNIFNKVKNELEKSKTNVVSMQFGDTHAQRCNFITDLLKNDDDVEIVDIGCNNMKSYGFRLLKKLSVNNTLYHAIDVLQEELDYINKIAQTRNYDNLVTYLGFDEFASTDNKVPVNIIMSEVFEHMELKESKKIIKYCLENLNVKNFIITSPNQDFNKYYNFDENTDKRRDDHVFEFNKEQFEKYFDKLLKPFSNKYVYEYINIGDIVDGISSTQCITIKQK